MTIRTMNFGNFHDDWDPEPSPAPSNRPSIPKSPEPLNTEDLLAGIAQFAAYAQAMSEVVSQVEQAAPHEVKGNDHSRMVEVTVGRSGEVRTVFINDDWQGYLSPGQLGSAFLTAFQHARGRLANAMMKAAIANGAAGKLDRISIDDFQPLPIQPEAISTSSIANVSRVLDDSLSETERLLNESSGLAKFTGEAHPDSADVRVRIVRTSAEILACDIDTWWATSVPAYLIASSIKMACDEASNLARTSQSSTRAKSTPSIAEALEILSSLAE
ncbi:hypothetical protein [Nocardia sp. NPDC005825]|uniref:hypothetical protein n=1 Tax=unclassified Nocardia TaxID=2637762 RepID=UPI0033DECD3D